MRFICIVRIYISDLGLFKIILIPVIFTNIGLLTITYNLAIKCILCIYLNFCFIQIECVIGWYGENCNRRCAGHCKDGTTCNHVTGQCNEGCDTGWTGFMCDKGNFFLFYKISHFILELHYLHHITK